MRAIRFYKPYGVLSKFTDQEGRPTLRDYIKIPEIYAVGRLDMDSEGLLLLTDDGTLAYRLTDPAYAHPRTYWVQVERIPEEGALDQLRTGVTLGDYMTRPAQATLIDPPAALPERIPPIRFRKTVPTGWIELTLTEGRNRQVRHMTAAVGHPTLRIVRVAIGLLTLEGLTPGEYADLSLDETETLRRSVGKRPRA